MFFLCDWRVRVGCSRDRARPSSRVDATRAGALAFWRRVAWAVLGAGRPRKQGDAAGASGTSSASQVRGYLGASDKFEAREAFAFAAWLTTLALR